MADLQAASEAVERTKLRLQDDLHGNLVSRLRHAMDLNDDFPVPAFVLDSGLAQLNEALEQQFIDKMLALFEERRRRENEKSHEMIEGRKAMAKSGYARFINDPEGLVSRENFVKSVVPLIQCFYMANLPCSYRKFEALRQMHTRSVEFIWQVVQGFGDA